MLRGRIVWFAVGIVLVCAGGAVAQQTSTTVELTEVEIVYVTGNTVVFKLGDEVLQREVPGGFTVNVDGKDVPVSRLVPGQIVMVERTTTTTTYPTTKVVTVRNGEVLHVTGPTLVYREDGETKKVVVPSDFKFMIDGKSQGVEGLRKGMRLNATLITETGATSVTESEIYAESTAPAKPAPPKPKPVPIEPAAAAPAPELPKTGSQLPLVALAGGLLLALGAGLSLIRRFVF